MTPSPTPSHPAFRVLQPPFDDTQLRLIRHARAQRRRRQALRVLTRA